jgi:excisionase family DNA binding protein
MAVRLRLLWPTLFGFDLFSGVALLREKIRMATDERWVVVDEVAAHLGVNRDSVYRWIDRKGLPAHRVGRLFRFKLSEVDEWVRAGGAGEDTPTGKTPDEEGKED